MEIKEYKEVLSCRLCNSKILSQFLDFGTIPLGNNLQSSKQLAKNVNKYPLAINRCSNCNHFQLSVSVDPEKLYATNYSYLSSIGKSFIQHLKDYSIWASSNFSLNSSSLIVDIGSNDGSCLSFFKERGCKVLGVDPAKEPAKIANNNNIPTINAFFNYEVVSNILKEYGPADFITSHNVLAHVEDLYSTFKNIFRLLKEDANFVFEIGYFRLVLENNFFDTIYHEHLDYHHAAPLSKCLLSIGFNIISFSVNPVQGGSLRVHLHKPKSQAPFISKDAQKFIAEENSSILYKQNDLVKWESHIKKRMRELGEKIRSYSDLGKISVGYGVPTKLTLMLSLSFLTNKEIAYVVEDNKLKMNKFVPGTSIPTYSTKKLEDDKPDVIIIFAWNFTNDIISKLRTYIDWPVKCIVPLPNLIEINL